VTTLHGKRYLRAMEPLLTKQKCLTCHAVQGFNVGDVRGGLSVSIPLEPAFAAASHYNRAIVGLLGFLWLLGLSGIFLQGRKLVRQTVVAMENERLRDQAEMSLHYMSNYDRYTNLPNRYLFEERLGSILKSIGSQNQRLAVVALEIRNLRGIIDTHGESLGREFLKLTAERLALLIHEDDIVARLGTGRLICTLAQQADKPGTMSGFMVIEKSLCQGIEYQDQQFFPMISMGISFAPDDASEAGDLIQMASSVLDRSVERGLNGFEFFSKSLQVEAMERLAIESGLQIALAEERFLLHYQPQINVVTGEITGFEALLRWQNAAGELVPPDKFIAVAEETGLILPIGAWVLETACRQAVAFQRKSGRYLRAGVNVSAKQFRDPTLVDHIDRVLAETGLPPEFLEIEITENTFMDDPLKTVEILTDLKIRGIKVAIDDFGTGYSSLNYLKRFPVDRLKIDRSFIMDIVENEDDRVLVSLITNLAKGMGLEVIAEGVENSGQRDALLSLDCPLMQGFLYSRPLTAEDFFSFNLLPTR
jgi:diguanylate cyclase (GGDEF)-like protein